MTCRFSAVAPDGNSTSERNVPSSLEICRSANGRPESSSRSESASCNPSFSLYHSCSPAKLRTSIAYLSGMENGGLLHIYVDLLSSPRKPTAHPLSLSREGVAQQVLLRQEAVQT